jgi:hypothetical protein
MASLNELARQRKAVLRAVLGRVKLLDEKVQVVQSTIRRLLSRKRLVPESSEFAKVIEAMQIAEQALADTVNGIAQGEEVFNG